VHIEKLYFSLPEVQDRWQISETDLVYLAENDKLRLFIEPGLAEGYPNPKLGKQEINIYGKWPRASSGAL